MDTNSKTWSKSTPIVNSLNFNNEVSNCQMRVILLFINKTIKNETLLILILIGLL